MTHEDIENLCAGLPIKKIPEGRRNLNYAGRPIMDVVATRKKVRLCLPNLAFSTKNKSQYEQEVMLREICRVHHINPVYKHEVR
jgi:hypothetical protein